MSFASFDEFGPPLPPTNIRSIDNGQGVRPLTKDTTTLEDIYKTPFVLFSENRNNFSDTAKEVLKGINSTSDLPKIFFADKNIKRIQRKIKERIYYKTQGKYLLEMDQDETALLIAMRAVYLEYGRYLPKQIVRQVKELNERVVKEVTPGMITNIKQYYGYIRDINEPLKPMVRPMNVNSSGRQSLPSFTTTWGV